ncbi:MAG: hypothetical protein II816_02070 [Elusimicrobia bacterium]|nr:hypothetical protein [Elusimicrobiota bacterium]
MKKKILFITLLLFVFSTGYCIELVDRTYRESFSNDAVKEDFYKIQMRTASFFDRQTSSVNWLIESYRGTSRYSYDMFSRSFIIGKNGVLDAQAFLYDQAIAAISYLLAGQNKKIDRILKVCQREFPIQKSDYIGMYNAYKTDVPRKRWGLTPGADGNRVHLGPNMWIAIAALQYTAVTGKTDFVPFVIDMLKWAEGIKHYTMSDGEKGAASMGYGWEPPDWSKVYSTENVVDHYAVLKMLKKLYETGNEEIINAFKKAKYTTKDIDNEMENIERWLVRLIYDKNKQTFNMGYNPYGVDKTDALDTVSWAIAAITPERLVELGIDPFEMIKFADYNYLVSDNIDGTEIEGYDFTNQQGRRKNYRMIWFEGTNFHVTTLQLMSEYAKKVGEEELASIYRQKAEDILASVHKAAEKIKLIDNALPYVSKKPKEDEIFTTFAHDWEIPRGKDGNWVASSSSTGWFLIAASAFNPFDFDKTVKYKIFEKKEL